MRSIFKYITKNIAFQRENNIIAEKRRILKNKNSPLGLFGVVSLSLYLFFPVLLFKADKDEVVTDKQGAFDKHSVG